MVPFGFAVQVRRLYSQIHKYGDMDLNFNGGNEAAEKKAKKNYATYGPLSELYLYLKGDARRRG